MCFLKRVNKMVILIGIVGLMVCALGGCQGTEETSNSELAAVSMLPDNTYKTAEPATTEDAGEKEKLQDVMLYLPDAEAEYLMQTKVSAIKTPEGLVEELVNRGALPKGTSVNFFVLKDNGQYISLEDEVASMSDNLSAELDLSDAFLEEIQHTGTAGEAMMMGAVVNTLSENFKLKSIMVTANDAVIETGHCIYDEPLSFYDELVE